MNILALRGFPYRADGSAVWVAGQRAGFATFRGVTGNVMTDNAKTANAKTANAKTAITAVLMKQ